MGWMIVIEASYYGISYALKMKCTYKTEVLIIHSIIYFILFTSITKYDFKNTYLNFLVSPPPS